MFIFNKERLVRWPVDVPVAVDGGTIETQRYTATFRLLPDAEVRALVDKDQDNKALLRKVLVAADDVGVEGAEIEAFDDLREMLIDLANVRHATIRAYFDCLHGAPAKNVGTPPASGRAAAPAGTTEAADRAPIGSPTT